MNFGFQSGFLDFTVDFSLDFWISAFLPTGFFLYVLGYFSYSSLLSKKMLVVVLVN